MTPPISESAQISAREIVKIYRLGGEEINALRGVSLEVFAGEYLAVVGPSGSGKSTFMNLLGALDTPTRGSLAVAGWNLSALGPDDLARFRNSMVGFVFQNFNLLGRTTALDNIALPLFYAGLGLDASRRRARACLERVGLADRAAHQPSELSGGQQQRVAIARAIVNNPRIILADEPTGALDSQTGDEIISLFEELNAEGITVVIVTHERDVARRARRRIVFRDGQLVKDDGGVGAGLEPGRGRGTYGFDETPGLSDRRGRTEHGASASIKRELK